MRSLLKTPSSGNSIWVVPHGGEASLIGFFKNAFYKSIGNGTLRFPELEKVVLDQEVALNNRPLNYLKCVAWENSTRGEQTSHPIIADVVTIQDETKSRNHWKLGIASTQIKGRDDVVRRPNKQG